MAEGQRESEKLGKAVEEGTWEYRPWLCMADSAKF